MKIHVKYFASVRDLMKTDAEDLNIAASLSVYELWKQLTVKINAPENISAAIMRLQNFENRFLYVVKYLDKDISRYLTESEEAINFYYTVEEKSNGIKISLPNRY